MATPDYETIQLTRDGAVARLVLNRPDVLNAMTRELTAELSDAATRLDEDPSVRAVILTGAGKGFSVGGDLGAFTGQGDDVGLYIKQMAADLHVAISRLTRMNAPLVVAVNGIAAGAGFSLACLGDVVLAGESARFTLAYTKVGLSPDGGSTWFLPRVVGLRRATELALTNRILDAGEALEWGIVNRVVADADLQSEADAAAGALAEGAAQALAAAHRLLLGSFNESLETQMELEAREIAARAQSAEAREGMRALLEKRPPQFG